MPPLPGAVADSRGACAGPGGLRSVLERGLELGLLLELGLGREPELGLVLELGPVLGLGPELKLDLCQQLLASQRLQ